MLILSAADVWENLVHFIDTGKFPITFLKESVKISGSSYYIIIGVVVAQSIYNFYTWMTFFLGMVSCLMVYSISKDFEMYVERARVANVKCLKVIEIACIVTIN